MGRVRRRLTLEYERREEEEEEEELQYVEDYSDQLERRSCTPPSDVEVRSRNSLLTSWRTRWLMTRIGLGEGCHLRG